MSRLRRARAGLGGRARRARGTGIACWSCSTPSQIPAYVHLREPPVAEAIGVMLLAEPDYARLVIAVDESPAEYVKFERLEEGDILPPVNGVGFPIETRY